jgi:hypothetical protein
VRGADNEGGGGGAAPIRKVPALALGSRAAQGHIMHRARAARTTPGPITITKRRRRGSAEGPGATGFVHGSRGTSRLAAAATTPRRRRERQRGVAEADVAGAEADVAARGAEADAAGVTAAAAGRNPGYPRRTRRSRRRLRDQAVQSGGRSSREAFYVREPKLIKINEACRASLARAAASAHAPRVRHHLALAAQALRSASRSCTRTRSGVARDTP